MMPTVVVGGRLGDVTGRLIFVADDVIHSGGMYGLLVGAAGGIDGPAGGALGHGHGRGAITRHVKMSLLNLCLH